MYLTVGGNKKDAKALGIMPPQLRKQEKQHV
jgi:DNA-binding transcriptional regulator YdaS (Cro superfamily)